MVGVILNPQTGIGEVNIPTLAADTAVSVGFIGGDALAPFMNEIRQIFNRPLKSQSENFEKSNKIKEEIKENNKNFNIQQLNKLKEMSDTIHKSNEENVKLSGIIKDSIDKDEKIFNAYGKTFLNLLTKGAATYYQDIVKQVNMLRELESAGVQLHKGYDSLYEGANKAGMSMNDFAGHLKKMSPIIAQLNSAYKDGAKVFSESLANIDKNLLLTNDEKAAVFESLVNSLGPSQLQKMTNEQLYDETNRLAKEMKMLSVATGKSVENIAKENDIKSRELRIRAYAASRPQFKNIQSTLTSIGLGGNEWLDYFMSGGANMTPEMVTTIAGSDFLQAALPKIMQEVLSGTLNTESIKNIKKTYSGLLNSDYNKIRGLSGDSGIQMASAKSNIFQASAFGALDVIQGVMGLNTNTSLKGDTTEAEKTKELLANSKAIADSLNRIENVITDAKTGGIAGMNTSLNLVKGNIKTLSEKMVDLNDSLKSSGLSGMTTGLGATTLSVAVPLIGTFLGSIANKYVEKGIHNIFNGLNFIKNTPKKSLISKANIKKGGLGVIKSGAGLAKRFAAIDVLYNGINNFLSYKNGEQSGFDTFANTINDSLVDSSFGLADKVGGVMYGIGHVLASPITGESISDAFYKGYNEIVSYKNQSKPNSQIGDVKEQVDESVKKVEEHNNNMEQLTNETNKHLTELIDLYKEKMSIDYNNAIYGKIQIAQPDNVGG